MSETVNLGRLTIDAGLKAFVDVNPVSKLVDVNRGFMNGNVDASDVILVLAIAAALTLIFAPVTIRLYRTRT